MLKNLDELMMKMCASENDGVGVEVDGLIYFCENFQNDDGISRAYRHFGTDKPIKFYSMTWAHQRRIKELMDLYNGINDKHSKRARGMARHIAQYVDKWSGCGYCKAIEQVENSKVSYLSIA